MSYNFDKLHEIVVYGVNNIGQDLKTSLEHAGYKVWGYVDQNALSIEIPENVFMPQQFFEMKEERDNKIILLTFQNALQHENVAKSLAQAGFFKIIYLPLSGNAKSLTSKMRNIYNECLSFQFEDLTNIPDFQELNQESCNDSEDFAGRKNLKVFIPADIIYTDDEYKINTLNEKKLEVIKSEIQKRYSDKPIILMKHYLELFEFFLYGIGNCHEYICWSLSDNAYTKKQKRDLLNIRFQLFQIYEYEYEYESDFFLESAAKAVWNEKGYFNIKDGHHRVTYLIAKGYNMIPLRISNEDFGKYIQKDLYDSVSNILPNIPIAHLHCLKYAHNIEMIKYSIALITCFEKLSYTLLSVLDISRNRFYTAPIISKVHIEKIYVMNLKDKRQEIVEKILDLTHCGNNVEIIDKIPPKNELQCVILDVDDKDFLNNYLEIPFIIGYIRKSLLETIEEEGKFGKNDVLFSHYDGVETTMLVVFSNKRIC